jgi:hypothetical protein
VDTTTLPVDEQPGIVPMRLSDTVALAAKA